MPIYPPPGGGGGGPGTPGPPGDSAYELAVEEGFVGTLEEWLASLVGPKGDNADLGAPVEVSNLAKAQTLVYQAASYAFTWTPDTSQETIAQPPLILETSAGQESINVRPSYDYFEFFFSNQAILSAYGFTLTRGDGSLTLTYPEPFTIVSGLVGVAANTPAAQVTAAAYVNRRLNLPDLGDADLGGVQQYSSGATLLTYQNGLIQPFSIGQERFVGDGYTYYSTISSPSSTEVELSYFTAASANLYGRWRGYFRASKFGLAPTYINVDIWETTDSNFNVSLIDKSTVSVQGDPQVSLRTAVVAGSIRFYVKFTAGTGSVDVALQMRRETYS